MSEGKVRVLHPITRLIVGGAQENTMFTAALLDKKRFKVEVLSGPQTGSEGSLIEEVRARGIPLTIMPEMVRQISIKQDLQALWKLYRLLQGNDYTIVHTHSSKAGVIGRIAAHLAGVPVIVHTVHGWSFHDQMSAPLRKMYILLERLASSLSDAMIVVAKQDVSKGLRERIGHPDQYILIRSAIPLDKFNPGQIDGDTIRRELGLPIGVPVLGNVGRFSAQKNPLDWIRVAGKVNRCLPECYFLLVGDGPLRHNVEALIKQEGLNDRTILTGLRRDVSRMMAAMDVFLLTSLWEGLPRVLPQSQAMKLPVVANRVDGLSEAILHGETGYLVEPGNTKEMAEYCLTLLQNPTLRKTMGERGRERVIETFDVRQMVVQIAQLYEKLLAT